MLVIHRKPGDHMIVIFEGHRLRIYNLGDDRFGIDPDKRWEIRRPEHEVSGDKQRRDSKTNNST
jgi:hypothetical protein